ncbi:MAG: helix-turn-helix domain-containing protein [Prevotellaceae bacterium]|jgi:transcriptional regulator with XRE-family HTH domain|nr:helix-turn-helix domain-containing protein [Prevotellaceae bacterium]
MDEITQRFLDYYSYLKNDVVVKNATQFAKSIGISNSLMTEILKKRSNIGLSPIQKIVQLYGANAEWLLTGKGEMIKNTQAAENTNSAGAAGSKVYGNGVSEVSVIAGLMKSLEKKDEQLDRKDEQIDRLLGIIEKLR